MPNHRRFFISPETVVEGTAHITGDTARQITKVLRLKEGDFIRLLDGGGGEHDAIISSMTRDEVRARVICSGECAREPAIPLTLAICLPKGDKVELIVQKCSELGISKLIVTDSERTVAKLDDAKAAERLARWRRIAAEAAEQCGRAMPPEIDGIMQFAQLTEELADAGLALVAWEEETGTTLKQALREKADAGSVFILIGPEGGLTEREVELAKGAGAVCVSLGKRILRAETAAIAACANVMYEIED